MSPIGITCPACGRLLGKTARRCPDCGAEIEPTALGGDDDPPGEAGDAGGADGAAVSAQDGDPLDDPPDPGPADPDPADAGAVPGTDPPVDPPTPPPAPDAEPSGRETDAGAATPSGSLQPEAAAPPGDDVPLPVSGDTPAATDLPPPPEPEEAAGVPPEAATGAPTTEPPATPPPPPAPLSIPPPDATLWGEPVVAGSAAAGPWAAAPRPGGTAVAGETAAAGTVPIPAASEAPPAPPATAGPDLNLVHALRRAARRNPIAAALAVAAGAAVVVLAATLLVGLLDFVAHTRNGCSAEPTLTAPGTCADGGQAPGLLSDWNAVLWSVHGAGVVFSGADGSTAIVRIPLAGGILLVALALYAAGRVSVALVPPRRPRDIAVHAAAIAAAYAVVMCIVGAALTARGEGLNVAPDYGILALWCVVLGFVAAGAGIARRLFGPMVPRMPLIALRARAGRLTALLEAALGGAAVALALSAVAGLLAMATHVGDTAEVVRNTVGGLTTRPFPDSAIGTVAAVVHLVLAGPTIAAWVLAYSLAIPTVTVTSPGAGPLDHGLMAGSHDAWLWAALVIPLAGAMFCGYAAARMRRAGSVESALVEGTLAGLALVAVLFLVMVLLDGGGSASAAAVGLGTPGGLPAPTVVAPFYGPGLVDGFLALLLFCVVGGWAGAYVSLATVGSEVRVWPLRRYNASRIGAPLTSDRPACPACGARIVPSARFCPSCGTALRT